MSRSFSSIYSFHEVWATCPDTSCSPWVHESLLCLSCRILTTKKKLFLTSKSCGGSMADAENRRNCLSVLSLRLRHYQPLHFGLSLSIFLDRCSESFLPGSLHSQSYICTVWVWSTELSLGYNSSPLGVLPDWRWREKCWGEKFTLALSGLQERGRQHTYFACIFGRWLVN